MRASSTSTRPASGRRPSPRPPPTARPRRPRVEVRSETVTLAAGSPATYGRMVVFTGSLKPAASSTVTLTAGGRTLGHGTTGPGGGFRIRARAGAPGPVVAHAGQAASQPFQLAVRPAVTIAFTGHRGALREAQRGRAHPSRLRGDARGHGAPRRNRRQDRLRRRTERPARHAAAGQRRRHREREGGRRLATREHDRHDDDRVSAAGGRRRRIRRRRARTTARHARLHRPAGEHLLRRRAARRRLRLPEGAGTRPHRHRHSRRSGRSSTIRSGRSRATRSPPTTSR